MDHLHLPTPKLFDVLFIRSKTELSIASVLLQPFADKQARLARKRFSHVAVVLNGQFALEAVPTQEFPEGRFTGAPLEPGVRFIPLLDILVPAWQNDSNFVAMRSQRGDGVAPGEFSLHSPYILQLLGSEYSLKEIRDSAEIRLHLLPKQALSFLREKFNKTSPASDLGSKIAEKEVRQSLETLIPGYVFPFQTSSFFCSKLASHLLSKSGLVNFGEDIDTVTPTGLFARLEALKEWEDVTETDYSQVALQNAASKLSPDTWRTEYLATKGEVAIQIMFRGIDSAFELKGAVDRVMEEKFGRLLMLTEKLDLANPLRQIARTQESKLITYLADNLSLTTDPERQQFLTSARDIVRTFGWGGFSRAQMFKLLVNAIPTKSYLQAKE